MTLQKRTNNLLYVAMISGFILFLSSCSPRIYSEPFSSNQVNQEYTDKRERTQLIGLCTRDGLKKAPYAEWFNKNYNDYAPHSNFKNDVKNKMKGIDIKVFMGTWCGDSKKEVPRFYKLMDEIAFDKSRIQLVNLNNEQKVYKQCPEGFEKGLNIHRVPTFIFYKEGKEIGRIVEHPVTSLETDITQIVHGFPSATRYPGVAKLDHILNEKGDQYVYDNALQVARAIYTDVRNDRALNTYGYVEKFAKKDKKALAIFKVNSILFKKEPNVHDSLGEAYWALGNKEKALQSYRKVLEIKPDDKNALEMIQKIEES